MDTGDIIKTKIVGVFMGGVSEEQEVSLKSGGAIAASLRKSGYTVKDVLVQRDDREYIAGLIRDQGIDAAFIALHGGFGEDGRIQQMFEDLKIPYTGSGPRSSAIAMNKILFKETVQRNNIRIPRYTAVSKDTSMDVVFQWKHFPCVVKPYASGSSKGVHVVHDIGELRLWVETSLGYTPWVLIEEYISGKELTVGVFRDRALIPIEIVPVSSQFFDYQSKYTKGATRFLLPAEVSGKITGEAQQCALKVHKVLGCSDLSRVDMIVNEHGCIYTLELNSIPGFTACSLLPLAAAYDGITFDQLCEQILLSARLEKDHCAKNNKRLTEKEAAGTAS